MTTKVPKQVYVDVTSKCNLKCKYCPSAEHPEKAQEMDWQLFNEIVEKFREIKDRSTFLPWCLGEPFMHPRWADICETMVEEGFRWYVATNGHIWDEDALRLILDVERGAYQLVFSVDGYLFDGSRSLEICRPGTNRAHVTDHMLRARQLRDVLGSGTNLAVKICDRGQDWEEIENFIQYWLKHDFDYVVYGKRLYGENPESLRVYPCRYVDDFMMYILADGSVARCFFNQEALYNPDYRMDLLTRGDPRSLVEVYNNERFERLRSSQHARDWMPPCDKCGMAYTGGRLEGEVRFTRGELSGETVYFHRDFYNSFFSLKKDFSSVLKGEKK